MTRNNIGIFFCKIMYRIHFFSHNIYQFFHVYICIYIIETYGSGDSRADRDLLLVTRWPTPPVAVTVEPQIQSSNKIK